MEIRHHSVRSKHAEAPEWVVSYCDKFCHNETGPAAYNGYYINYWLGNVHILRITRT